MEDVFFQLSLVVMFASICIAVLGFIFLFVESKRKLGLKMLLGAVIAFIIGFSTCVGTFNLKL